MTSLEWFQRREPQERALPDFPTLDDAWRWYLQGLTSVDPSLEAVCVYAADVRQGRWPDRVPAELSVQGVFLALAQDTLLVREDRAAFERDATVLFDAVARHVSSGRSILDEPFVNEVSSLQRYVAQLADDQRLFAEDLARGRTLEVTLPAEASPFGARAVQLVVLDRPASTQFKVWARRTMNASLLLVRQVDGSLVVTADPSRKLTLEWLAQRLSALDARPWYAGERHEGTLIASPREGSRLRLEDVERLLGAKSKSKRRVGLVGVTVSAAVALSVGAALFPRSERPAEASRERVAPVSSTGAKGAPLPPEKVRELLEGPTGPHTFEAFALVAGVCGYSGEKALQAPCRDARAVRDLLVTRLGYRRENIVFLVDRPEPGEATDGVPTAPVLKLAVERFRERFQADETSSFLFYYSGHGGFEAGARKDFGVLQPAGYFEADDRPISERGWDMQELIDDLRKGVPSKHVMVILDACYSGWAAGAKGEGQLSRQVHALWNERAEVVLTAATRGQRAWEDEREPKAWAFGGHSAMTAFLLEGLGRSAADLNADRVITDEELASYLSARVPAAVREARQAVQTPQFFRFDEQFPRSGQFLFLPQEAP